MNVPTYPCGLIREHFANIARAFNWSEQQGENSVQDLNEKCINFSVVEIGILSEKLSLEVSR